MKNPIYLLIFIFLCTISHAEENWNDILLNVTNKMYAETMTYIEKDTYRNGIKIQYFISQKKSSDGIVTRVEEQLTRNGKRQKKEELTSTDVIHRTYYTPEGNYRLLIHNNRCVGMLIVGEKYLIPFSLAYREISGKEIEYNNTLCWEITETAKSSRGMLKYIITVEKKYISSSQSFKDNGRWKTIQNNRVQRFQFLASH